MGRRTRVLVALGVALLVGGVVVALQPRASASFGWTAYTPLSDATFTSPALVVLDVVGIAGVVVSALGLALLAGLVGYRLGAREATPPSE